MHALVLNCCLIVKMLTLVIHTHDTFEVLINEHILQLCLHFVLHLKLQLYLTVNKPKITSSFEVYSVHTSEVSPHTIEHVICVFWLALDLVLVLMGFSLFQICSPFFFSPHSKDHALHQPVNTYDQDMLTNPHHDEPSAPTSTP